MSDSFGDRVNREVVLMNGIVLLDLNLSRELVEVSGGTIFVVFRSRRFAEIRIDFEVV
jgi:hypothetical protein